jgi:hypothetical protein
LLFVARWNITEDACERLLERFVRLQGRTPEGIRIVGRWHRTDGSGGFMIVEASSMRPLTELAYEWNDLLFVEIAPVVSDADLAPIIERLKAESARKGPTKSVRPV